MVRKDRNAFRKWGWVGKGAAKEKVGDGKADKTAALLCRPPPTPNMTQPRTPARTHKSIFSQREEERGESSLQTSPTCSRNLLLAAAAVC